MVGDKALTAAACQGVAVQNGGKIVMCLLDWQSCTQVLMHLPGISSGWPVLLHCESSVSILWGEGQRIGLIIRHCSVGTGMFVQSSIVA